MNKLITIVIVCILFSCSTGLKEKKEVKTLKEKGEIEVINGMDQKVSIPFEIVGLSDFENKMTLDDFNKIVLQSSQTAESTCKHRPTFEPVNIDLMMRNDTIITIFYFRAKNAFGVPDDLKSYSKYKGTILVESF